MEACSPSRCTWEEKLQQARECKLQGNEFYKKKQYKSAVRKYHHGLLYVKGIENAQQTDRLLPSSLMGDDARQNQIVPNMAPVNAVKVDLYNNLAACLLHTESPRYEKVVQYCQYILDNQPNNAKAIYRQAVAYYHLHNTENALDLLEQLQSMGHMDANIRRYLGFCRKEQSRQDSKLKHTYKAMFERAETGNKQADNLTSNTSG